MANEEVAMLDPKWIRNYAPGFIGGEEVAKKATDEEVLFLAELANEMSRLYSRFLDRKEKFNNLVEAIKKRGRAIRRKWS